MAVIFLLLIGAGLVFISLGAWWWMAQRPGAVRPSPTAIQLEAIHAAMRMEIATYAAERYMDDFIEQRAADLDWRWPS